MNNSPLKLRFRHIHLDFHTSPHIENIGGAFDKKQWQEALRAGHVNSINCFAKGHHGWSYHPTEVGKAHPHLQINLLREQIDACHEIDIKAPIYISAGIDNVASHEHPEWREVNADGAKRRSRQTTPRALYVPSGPGGSDFLTGFPWPSVRWMPTSEPSGPAAARERSSRSLAPVPVT